jgi:PAS domain S-box-containing protein
MNTQALEILLNANQILASTLEIDQLLNKILGLSAEVVQAETGSLLLLDERTHELVFDVALGEAGHQLKTIRLKIGEGIAGWVAEKNEPLILNDPAKDPRWTRRGDQKTQFVTRSILCVPLVHQGRLLGVVQAINKRDPNGFAKEDLGILKAFAAQAAVAIQNARLLSFLRQEKEKMDLILSQMELGAVYTNEKGQCLVANPSARNMFGISSADCSAYYLWDILKTFSLNPPLEQLKDLSQEVIPFEATRTEGGTFIISGLIKKIFSDKRELTGLLTVVRDITAEKKEEKLKRDFLSLMSHKLKTPLVAIIGYTPVLLDEDDPFQLAPFVKKAIQAIHKQGLHLKQLVEKLISFSMIDSENLKVDKKPFNVKELLNEIVIQMKTYLEDQKALVHFDASLEALPSIPVDYDHFREIFKGLIENAVKFNRNAEKKVKLSGKLDHQRVFLLVEDDGCGIPSQEFDKIFHKFYQIEESFTGQVEGAGLGLALIKRLVEVQGGTVQVNSTVGKGSIFTISFPLENGHT